MKRKILDKTIVNKIKILLFVACIFAALIFCLLAVIISLNTQVSDTALLDTKKLSLKTTEPWDGKVGVSFAGGKGSLEEPYRISSGAELAFLSELVNNDVIDALNGGKYRISKHYVLTNDIYLNDTTDWEAWAGEDPENTVLNKWTPIGMEYKDFSGDFDGCGFSVYGIYINTNSDNQALFGSVNLGRISNLGIKQSFVKGKYNVGGIGGWLGGTDIINCYNAGVISGAGSCTGGIAGYAGRLSVIINSFNSGIIDGHDNTGGIAGCLDRGGSVLNCYNTGDISSEGYPVGGIAGYVDYGETDATGSVVRNCYSTGRVSVQVKSGGVAGYSDNGCTVSHCYYLKTADINSGLEASASKSSGVSSVSSFSGAGVLASPITIGGKEYSLLVDALNAYAAYQNAAADAGIVYTVWSGTPFPGFGVGTPDGDMPNPTNPWQWYYTVIICSVTVLCAAVAVFYAMRRKRRVEQSSGLHSSSVKVPSLSSDELEAVRVLIRGGQDKAVSQSALAALPDSLTLREREVAGLLLAGQRSKEIAEKLFISNHTVKNHVQNILHKTNCPDQLSFVRKYEDGGCL